MEPQMNTQERKKWHAAAYTLFNYMAFRYVQYVCKDNILLEKIQLHWDEDKRRYTKIKGDVVRKGSHQLLPEKLYYKIVGKDTLLLFEEKDFQKEAVSQ